MGLDSILSSVGSILGGLFGSKKKKAQAKAQAQMIAHVDQEVDQLSAIVGQEKKWLLWIAIGLGVIGLIVVMMVIKKRR